jgi:hypothetical protein
MRQIASARAFGMEERLSKASSHELFAAISASSGSRGSDRSAALFGSINARAIFDSTPCPTQCRR